MADMPESSEELSVLKSTINKPIDKLETFPAPKNVTNVKFFTCLLYTSPSPRD